MVEHQSSYVKLKPVGCNSCWPRWLPVVPEVLNVVEESIVFDQSGIQFLWNSILQHAGDGFLDSIGDGAFEKHLKDGRKVCPEATSDFDFDVLSVDVDLHVYWLNLHQFSFILPNIIRNELDAEFDINFIHIDFDVSLGDHERGNLVPQVFAFEFGGQLFAF